jgi:hypothetical protein
MAIPEMVRRQAELLLFAFCQSRVPEGLLSQYHLAFRIRQHTATLYECFGPERFSESNRKPTAQFRYDPDRQVWILYRADHNLRWHIYDGAKPTADLTDLLMEVHIDP